MEKLLLTPGPLSTTMEVKQKMLYDYGSRDSEFLSVIKDVRKKLLEVAIDNEEKRNEYETVLMQGSGTFGNEAVLNSLISKNDTNNKLLIISNGKYAERLAKIAKVNMIETEIYRSVENVEFNYQEIREIMNQESIKYVAMVHHETSTGQLNDVSKVGSICRELGKTFIIDAMSSFGGIELDLVKDNIDFLVSSPNKCLEGVPGFCYILCKKTKLLESKFSTSLSLDILDQWNYMEKTGQFRFTPPTHNIVAFNKALDDHFLNGGVQFTLEKYAILNKILVNGMEKLGFQCQIKEELRGHFITSFYYLNDNFNFDHLYDYLNENNFVIYPGDASKRTFRIGNIGNLTVENFNVLLTKIKEYVIKLDTSNNVTI
jgi:2-aminoethylphosphonate-pyruvate transaminase